MIESAELFDFWYTQEIYCRCGKPIIESEWPEAVMVRVYIPSQDTYEDKGPFHKVCGRELQEAI